MHRGVNGGMVDLAVDVFAVSSMYTSLCMLLIRVLSDVCVAGQAVHYSEHYLPPQSTYCVECAHR